MTMHSNLVHISTCIVIHKFIFNMLFLALYVLLQLTSYLLVIKISKEQLLLLINEAIILTLQIASRQVIDYK